MHKQKMISGLLISLGGLISAIQFFFIYSSLDSYAFSGIDTIFPFFPIIELTFGFLDLVSGIFHTEYMIYTFIIMCAAIIVFFLGIIMSVKPHISVAVIAMLFSLFLGSIIPLLLTLSGGCLGLYAILNETQQVSKDDKSSA